MFAHGELATILNIKPGLLASWCARQIVQSSLKTGAGSGGRRYYSTEDVIRIAAIDSLRRSGIRLERAAKIVAGVDFSAFVTSPCPSLVTAKSHVAGICFSFDELRMKCGELLAEHSIVGVIPGPYFDKVLAAIDRLKDSRAVAVAA